MTEPNGHVPPPPPEPVERGRYAIIEQRDGGLLILRTVDLCDTCLDCRCGEVADPVGPIPASVVAMARAAAAGKISVPQAIKKAMKRG